MSHGICMLLSHEPSPFFVAFHLFSLYPASPAASVRWCNRKLMMIMAVKFKMALVGGTSCPMAAVLVMSAKSSSSSRCGGSGGGTTRWPSSLKGFGQYQSPFMGFRHLFFISNFLLVFSKYHTPFFAFKLKVWEDFMMFLGKRAKTLYLLKFCFCEYKCFGSHLKTLYTYNLVKQTYLPPDLNTDYMYNQPCEK